MSRTIVQNKLLFAEEPEELAGFFAMYKYACPSISRQASLQALEALINIPPKKQKKKDGSFVFKQHRHKFLIADLSTGYIKDWAFQVHGVFAKSLDIRDKILNKREKELNVPIYKTQGNLFSFSENQMIYDTYLAYSSPWSESLKHIKTGILIDRASPASIDEETGKRHPGVVAGWIYRNTGKKIEKYRSFSVTQDELVRILIMGFEEDKQ
jgi:hypothetical protein